MDIAFDFTWRGTQPPFIGDQSRSPTFHNVRAWDIYEGKRQELASDESHGSDHEFQLHMTRKCLKTSSKGLKPLVLLHFFLPSIWRLLDE
jgi:hypothetical protein